MKKIYIMLLFSSIFNINSFTENSTLYYGEHSGNFVIRWAFQEICDHVYDLRRFHKTKPKGVTVNPDDVKLGDLILVRDISTFMKKVHKKIKKPYIIISAGEFRDRTLPEYEIYLNDNKVIAWFGVHPCCYWKSEKFFPIPLGINQRHELYTARSQIDELFRKLRNCTKENLLYMNFRKKDNKEGCAYDDREYVFDLFVNKSFCNKGGLSEIGELVPFDKYLDEMAKSKFTLSPDGLGPDCYRTWEALLVGTIPIVKKSPKDRLFKNLPVLIVNEWTDVTPELLNKTWNEFTKKRFNIEKLYIDYWIEKIHSVRRNLLNNWSTQE